MPNQKPPRLRTVERTVDYIRGVTVTWQNWGTPFNADFYYTVDVHLGRWTYSIRTNLRRWWV